MSNGNNKENKDQGQVWLTLLSEINEELRSRRQAEYLYTAAAIAAFGAIVWGVAALSSNGNKIPFALTAALGVFALSCTIVLKICIEHCNYKKIRGDQHSNALHVTHYYQIKLDQLPKVYQTKKAGKGHLWSISIVMFFGFAAFCFCLFVIKQDYWWVVIRGICALIVLILIVLCSFYKEIWEWLKRRRGKTKPD